MISSLINNSFLFIINIETLLFYNQFFWGKVQGSGKGCHLYEQRKSDPLLVHPLENSKILFYLIIKSLFFSY